ncbi:MAG: SGNH/GDSL hydrolase family protein [Catenulispora sp.]|nr:SGNH/GDSL hydrolase family protein [Catenulispora sp.]
MTEFPLEAADPYCLNPGEAEKLLTGHPWRRFAVLGDSIAEGVSEPVPGYSPLPFADRVAAELAQAAPGLQYLNLGHRGLRTHEVRATQLAAALAFAPDLALLACGANDALRPGYETRAATVDADQAEIIQALQHQGALVITVSIFVRPAYPSLPTWLRPTGTERMTTLGARTTALATTLGTLHIDLARHPLAPAPDSLSTDGLHGNARAQTVAATETIRALAAHRRAPSFEPRRPLGRPPLPTDARPGGCPDFAAAHTSSAAISLHRRES